MELHVEAIRRDLVATASVLGDDSLVDTLRRLVDASEPALRLRLIDVLQEATVSLNGQLGSGHVEVRLAGRDPELVYVPEADAPEEPPAPGDDLSARISLRLPESVKTGVESAAAREGVSANAWIVRALARAIEPRHARRSQNRLQGFARS
ncbi:YlcI/YnfO family protein [Gaiella sp.]|jgi:predicted HicB family RNase H-like nuclease|uniref:YlcI/YnfO family protein n=1 Tax=Gaiella sp. TaxID=2663207 RepID=UPI002E37D6B2|nr:YlcI/YnfO family protein [Gaiella sp.]HEX5584264.1 YlcI/YnfO family protein [Gaiella sp.]